MLHRLEFDVPWPPKHVAAYLLDGPEPILIDAGRQTDASEATLDRSLAEFGYSSTDIDHVLVTHAHSDHIGQVPTLSDAGATIHGPAASLERLERDPETVRASVRETARSAGYTGEDLEEIVDSEVDSFHRDRRLLDPATTRPIEPETTVSIGTHEFHAFETPGHEQNHLSYEADLEGTTALFSGDALIEPFRAGTFHAGIDRGAYEGVDRYYDAMDRFFETSATHAFPGHGPTFTDPKRVATRTRERLDQLLGETLAALESIEPATPLEIAVERAGSVRYTAPVMDTLGALGTLENRGLVDYDFENGARYYRRR